MADIESDIFDMVARKANIERGTLSRDTELSSIELKSIDMLEIMFDIEEKFNISLLYNANQSPSGNDFKTAGEFIDFVKGHLDKSTPAA